MDVAGAIGFITLLVSIGALWFAWRATAISQETLSFDRARDRAAKLAQLEFIGPHYHEKTWRSMGRTIRDTVPFETRARNRGPAAALDLKWSAAMGSTPLRIGNALDFLYELHDYQFILEAPLGPDLAPLPDPIQIEVASTDQESRKTYRWCVRFAGDRLADPASWTLEDLDCISLKPRSATWAQPLPNR
jgi:hypothetical protein